eukprot:gene43727-16290_t
MRNWYAGAVMVKANNVNISGNTFIGNVAVEGGALKLHSQGSIVTIVVNNYFKDNIGAQGGAIHSDASRIMGNGNAFYLLRLLQEFPRFVYPPGDL